MRSKRFFLTWFAAVALISIAGAGVAQATPPSGVTSTLFAVGAFDEFSAKVVGPDFQVRLSTKGTSDVHVLENRLAPGATFGWHSHPGPSLVVVKTGDSLGVQGRGSRLRARDRPCGPRLRRRRLRRPHGAQRGIGGDRGLRRLDRPHRCDPADRPAGTRWLSFLTDVPGRAARPSGPAAPRRIATRWAVGASAPESARAVASTRRTRGRPSPS